MNEILNNGPAKCTYENSSLKNDFVTEAAIKSFGISYLFPWQRIVVSNILEAAGITEDSFSEKAENCDANFKLTPEEIDFLATKEISAPEMESEDTLEESKEAIFQQYLTSKKEKSDIEDTLGTLEWEFVDYDCGEDVKSLEILGNAATAESSKTTGNAEPGETAKATAQPEPSEPSPPAATTAHPGPSEPSETPEIQRDTFCLGRQIVLLPTGAGKSLCFLTPALLLPGPTLVLYPLLALMSDQQRRMEEGNLKSVIFKGGQTNEERENALKEIKNGAKIILANPEVLQNRELVKRLSKCNISHIAIDEAHCVSEWGDSFRPAYLTLGNIIKELGCQVVTAFTATASPSVLNRVAQVLFDGKAHVVQSDSDRPNIRYSVVNACDKKKMAFTLAAKEQKPLIIFCGTRNKSEDMARELALVYGKDKVKFYHAGLEKSEKTKVEQWFYEKEDGILCSTCAYGMGVDKKNIRTVIHLEASPTAESYIQEAGRGGRDGEVSKAILLWSPEDARNARKSEKGSRKRVLATFAESETCRRKVLLNALGDSLTYCAGCDVCERGGKAPFAEDGQFVLDIIHKNRKHLSKVQAATLIMKELNQKDIALYGRNIWDNKDVNEILGNLKKEGYIRTCIWPWKGRLTTGWNKRKVSSIYKGKFYRKLVKLQIKIDRIIYKLKKIKIG